MKKPLIIQFALIFTMGGSLIACSNNNSSEQTPFQLNENVEIDNTNVVIHEIYREFMSIGDKPSDSFKRYYIFDTTISNNKDEAIIIGEEGYKFEYVSSSINNQISIAPSIIQDVLITNLYTGDTTIEAKQTKDISFVFWTSWGFVKDDFIRINYGNLKEFVSLKNLKEREVSKTTTLEEGYTINGANFKVAGLVGRDSVSGGGTLWTSRTLNLVKILITNTSEVNIDTSNYNFEYTRIDANGSQKAQEASAEYAILGEEGLGLLLYTNGTVAGGSSLAGNRIIGPSLSRYFIIAFDPHSPLIGTVDNILKITNKLVYEYASLHLGNVEISL
jgi:hypothetical protein